ncbi:2-oxoglutarate and iron-dependent oxygenase domain-containing protein [Pseudomonas sp. HR96]|uniref:2-oxoglutarate and iron-dependent oxygenase domain-containing protein n=1 Tax=Pseudomonas sp. HR96 TaxID=1027966 RepID=UPI002A75A3D4|nr:2-oxoglutarate and iron-dependent oxygenase domain-containing protein [Pseudomonas sp. HR96]WPP00523.1 2-oxoglutarate and iron-dependent oxygenase domain-containing protein [Pseudomonas sp. HR96]
MRTLPVIDISPLYQDDAEGAAQVADAIDRACRQWGFFYISGHPISAARIGALSAAAETFFALPLAQKLAIDITQTRHHRGYGAIATEQLDPALPSDLKETFDMGLHLPMDHPQVIAGKPLRGPNRHPQLPGWEALLEQHYLDMQALALTLLRAMTHALGVPRDFFDQRFVEPVSVLRMIHYPPRHTATSAAQQGAGAHTDYGCITLLHQDQAGGLQVRTVDGQWLDAPPIEGTFVVNLGDMMARWTNDRYRSTPHRVISPLGVDRYSMPFFAEPHPDTRVECLPGCQDAEHPPRYPATTCAEFLLSRFADTYAYRRPA